MSTCPSSRRIEQIDSHWTNFHEIWYLGISRKSMQKFEYSLNSDKNNGYFTWKPMYIFNNILLNTSYNEKFCRQNLWRKSKHTFYPQKLCSKIRAVYVILWKDMVQPGMPQMAIRRVHISYWITNITGTSSECVTLIAFPRQQWFHEVNSMLRSYVHCLSCW